jgi:lipoprotein-anchoring transpeptidase ErfK/SrfK
LPGYPASHGCIRFPFGFAKKLYGITNTATRVTITRARPRSAEDALDLS